MKTETHVRYEVSIRGEVGGSFSRDGRKNWTSTYNYKDCLNHIKELKEHVYMGKKIYADSEFQIAVITEIKTTIPV